MILKRDLEDFPGLISSQIICLEFAGCCGVGAGDIIAGKFCMPSLNLFGLTLGNYQLTLFEAAGHLMVFFFFFNLSLLTSRTRLSTFSSSLVSQNLSPSKEDGTKSLPRHGSLW